MDFRHICILLFIFSITVDAQVFADHTGEVGIHPTRVEIQYGSGSNLVDVDKNGFIDIFSLAGSGYDNKLYLNNGTYWSEPVSIGDPDLNSRAAVWFDYDGDHLLDVFILSDCANTSSCFDFESFALYRNNGNGTFTDVSLDSKITNGLAIKSEISNANYSGGIAAGDLNLDGYLDLIITKWGGELYLFENQGDGTFNNASDKLNRTELLFYWQPVIFNLDDDIWPEIYVAVDANDENAYLDKIHGSFIYEDRASELNLHHKFNDMGITLGDFDQDLDFDIYISNIERFRDDSRNVLFVNENGTYNDEALAFGVDKAGWSWGVTFCDINNDGCLDIGTTNGWEAHNLYRNDQSKMWLGSAGSQSFIDVSEQVNFNDTLNASSLTAADMDRDGDLDLVQGLKDISEAINLRYHKNDLQESSCSDCNYVIVQPRMMGQNHWAIGSTVGIKTASGHQIRPITSGISFYGQEPAEAFFGVGADMNIEKITIKWPSGDSTVVHDFSANQIITVYDSASIHNVGLVQIESINNSAIQLDWGHMSTTETHYIIQRSEEEGFSQVIEIQVNSNNKMYLDEGLTPFTDYYYRIKAVGNSGESEWSESYFATTREEAPAPIDFRGELTENNYIELTWNDTSNLDIEYEILRSLDATFENYLSLSIDNSQSSFTDQNVEPGFKYYYKIRQNTDVYLTPFSDVISIEVPKIPDFVLTVDATKEMKPVVYPNPTSGIVYLTGIEKINRIEIYDLGGRLVHESEATNQLELNLVEGLYTIYLIKEFKKINSQILIIQH
ncbi:FG-GAP-like repeat-containing protein [Ekhidna sp.]|uniref:FG-GAP-like repeat-containing protein n=1 Tax=Ekhidna sp. TaxID=2608089 RepID=UPI003298550D